MAMMKQLTASGPVTSLGSGAKLCGYEVVVATSAVVINVRNESVTGTIVMVIPISQAAGSRVNLSQPIAVPKGIYADFGAATGTVNFLFE